MAWWVENCSYWLKILSDLTDKNVLKKLECNADKQGLDKN